MSASDPLAEVWSHADAAEARFSADEVSSWPAGHARLLNEAQIIRRDDNATTVVCDACHDGHIEEVVFIESPPGSPIRAYIHCPEAGRVLVPLERLRQWVVDFPGLAGAAATGLDLAGAVDEVVRVRLWSLGKTTIGGRTRDVFLGRGTTWTDAPGIFGQCERLNAARGALVLVPGDTPPTNVWTGDPPCVVPLKLVARLADRRLAFDRDHLESLLSGDRRKAPVKAPQSFPTPPGTAWQEVMVWVTDLTVTIEAKGLRRDFTFVAAGFEEKRKGDVPDAIWALLKVFAMRGGVIPYDGTDLDHNTRMNLKQYVTELRKRLRAVIPNIGRDPVPYDKDGRCYKTAFKIASQDSVTFPVPAGTTWPNVTITLTRGGAMRISVPTTKRYAASTYAKEPGGDVHRWELAERDSELARKYDLRMIGLADDSGRHDPRGAVLLEVLRAKGVVSRPADDDAMLALCGVLSKLMARIDGSPFDFASGGQTWVALFQTSCE